MKKYKLINFCEFDKYATKSYCAIYGVDEILNLGDITKVNEKEIEDFTMMTWGFPCTDISVAGRQIGFEDKNGDKTRSGLYYEGMRILKEKKPKISIIENVKNLTSKKFKAEFEQIISDLNECGYNTYWKIIDSKNFGIPQHRERIFIVSIRKDIDNGKFKFPTGLDSIPKIKDILEEDIGDKYNVLESKKLQFFENENYNVNMDKHCVGTCHPRNDLSYATRNRVYSEENVSPTLSATMYKDPPKIIRKKLINVLEDNTEFGQQANLRLKKIINQYQIRTFTPLETWRLMGFKDEDFYKAKESGVSNTQLYKQAGNSIVVDVLFYIYIEIYKAMPNIFNDLKLSSFFSGIGAFEKALDRLYNDINNNTI